MRAAWSACQSGRVEVGGAAAGRHEHQVGERLDGHRLAGQREQLGAQPLALGQPVVPEGLEVAAANGDRQHAGVAEPARHLHGLGGGLVAAPGFGALQLEGQRDEQPAAQPDELNRLLATGGRPARIVLAATRPGYARLERRAFGTSPATPDTPATPGNRTSTSSRGVTMFQSHLRRFAAVLTAVTAGLLASVASIPAAFAREVPLAAAHHAATTVGLTPWQIALTTVGPTAAAAAVGIVLARVIRRRGAHRAAPSPTA
jgi:hypothetical protein